MRITTYHDAYHDHDDDDDDNDDRSVSSSSANQLESAHQNKKTTMTSNDRSRRRRRRPRRRRPSAAASSLSSFGVLVLQVGTTLAILCLVAGTIYRRWFGETTTRAAATATYDDDDDEDDFVHRSPPQQQQQLQLQLQQQQLQQPPNNHDPYNLADRLESVQKSHLLERGPFQTTTTTTTTARSNSSNTITTITTDSLYHVPIPLATLDVDPLQSRWDAYGIAQQWQNQPPPHEEMSSSSSSSTMAFWTAAEGLRTRFAQDYGGEQAARYLLQHALRTFGDDDDPPRDNAQPTHDTSSSSNSTASRPPPRHLIATACRFVRALQPSPATPAPAETPQNAHHHGVIRFAFGGYSVTVGRGNTFAQSFPFVTQRQLHTVLQLLNATTLLVTNAAIGGCPAFPYGWCLSNFWSSASSTSSSSSSASSSQRRAATENRTVQVDSTILPDADVVSWDFSMNEAGGDPVGLEAYIRHVLQLPKQPKLIVKDSYALGGQRRQLLQDYHTNHYYHYRHDHNTNATRTKQTFKTTTRTSFLRDAVVLHLDAATEVFLQLPEAQRPRGFQNWRKFGAPLGAPGQQVHHPAKAEHELLGWILTMHFLAALQFAVAAMTTTPTNDSLGWSSWLACDQDEKDATREEPVWFGPPRTTNATEPWSSLLFGEPVAVDHTTTNRTQNRWKMNRIHCRTSFDPILSGPLSDIIIPTTTVGEDLDIMLPKSNMFYNRGWVLDLSDAERATKHSLNRFGGLGFRDQKKAYYGIYTSRALKLLLPYEPPASVSPSASASSMTPYPRPGDLARDWFKSVVICEVNEKRDNACVTERDVTFRMDGINVTTTSTSSRTNTSPAAAAAAAAQPIAAAGTLFLGKKICMYLPIPEAARLTTRAARLREQENTTTTSDRNSSRRHRRGNQRVGRLHQVQLTLADNIEDAQKESNSARHVPVRPEDEQMVGLAVDVLVHNPHIMTSAKACSVSHVIWEQKDAVVSQSSSSSSLLRTSKSSLRTKVKISTSGKQ